MEHFHTGNQSLLQPPSGQTFNRDSKSTSGAPEGRTHSILSILSLKGCYPYLGVMRTSVLCIEAVLCTEMVLCIEAVLCTEMVLCIEVVPLYRDGPLY